MMAKAPGIRIDGGKRIDLADLRRRRKAARENAAPIEDTRVSDAWARAEAKAESAARDQSERSAIASLPAKIEAVSMEKENPLWSRDHDGDKTNVRYMKVAVNMRESAITALAAKGVIDEAQCAAADRFRKAWEALGGAGAGAMDYTREPVDGGGAVEPITVKQLSAGQDLKDAQIALEKEYGRYAYKLVGYVCGEGHSIHDLTQTRRQRDTMTDNLRAYLDVLAALWSFAVEGSVRIRNDLTRARENGR